MSWTTELPPVVEDALSLSSLFQHLWYIIVFRLFADGPVMLKFRQLLQHLSRHCCNAWFKINPELNFIL